MGIASSGDVNDETVAISVAKEPVITAGKMTFLVVDAKAIFTLRRYENHS